MAIIPALLTSTMLTAYSAQAQYLSTDHIPDHYVPSVTDSPATAVSAPESSPYVSAQQSNPVMTSAPEGYSAPFGSHDAQSANGDIISGGVGESDQERMRALENDYTLKVLFAGREGEYLAMVNVTLTDQEGRVIYQGSTEGPILLARLAPGTYHLRAEMDGRTHTGTVKVGKNLSSTVVRL